jgi:Holliday junction resolvasome RuvABC DNA-binding subunit
VAEGGEVDVEDVEEEDDEQMPSLPINGLKGIGQKTAALLVSKGIKTIRDLAEVDLESLSSIPRIGMKKAEKLVSAARDSEEMVAHD